MQGTDYILDDAFRLDAEEAPARLAGAAGMLSHNERLLLFKLARDHYIGRGHIIDAGSFFGSSTVSLAEGLKANRFSKKIQSQLARPIVSYDIGYLPGPIGAKAPLTKPYGKYSYTWGESFVPIFRDNIAGHDDVVELRIGDFLKETWPADQPIEVCFIDLAKTNELNVHCFRQLFPAFMPGRTLLVQQDFFFDRLPWIKVLMGHVAEHFEWLGQVGPSSLYRYRSRIPAAKYAIDPFSDLTPDQRIACHQTSVHPGLSPRRQLSVALSLCYLLESCRGPNEALEELRDVRERFADTVAGMPALQARVDRAQAQFSPGGGKPDFVARAAAKARVTQVLRDLTEAGGLMAQEQRLKDIFQEWKGLPWAGPETEVVRADFVEAWRAAQRALNAEKRAAARAAWESSWWRRWLGRLARLWRRARPKRKKARPPREG